MTKTEWTRRRQQERTLIDLGFTVDEAEQLRRISRALHRWHERECGVGDGSCLVRGYFDLSGTFVYDADGAPYLELAGRSGRGRYLRVPDRERTARRRLVRIVEARNRRVADSLQRDPRGAALYRFRPRGQTAAGDVLGPPAEIRPYIQRDPRGAALYLLRPGDVPDGADPAAYYSRGVCVY